MFGLDAFKVVYNDNLTPNEFTIMAVENYGPTNKMIREIAWFNSKEFAWGREY